MSRIVLVVLTVLLFFVHAGGRPPATNEAHYLTRARHYWNPDWASEDLFLASKEAHLLFQSTFGAAAGCWPLPAVAWLGRCCGWLALAWGWSRLAPAVLGRHGGWALLAAALALMGWDYGQMSGEWVVGGIEAKVPAYAAVFCGLGAAAVGRWRPALLWFSLATAFHVLVGGWTLVAATPLALHDARRAWRRASAAGPSRAAWLGRQAGHWLPCLAVATLLVGVGLVPALMLDLGIERETVVAARKIYVFHRIDHHLLWHRFAWQQIARHVALIGVWAALWRLGRLTPPLHRLQWIVAGAVAIAVAGAILECLTAPQAWLCASTMRYYWFRLSDGLVPVGVSCLAVYHVVPRGERSARIANLGLAVLLLLTVTTLAQGPLQRLHDPRPAADQQGRVRPRDAAERRAALEDYVAWRELCAWCNRWTPAGSLFLTPWNIQTFKWYAGRAEFATWKDVPQDSRALVEWNRRRLDIRAWGLYRGRSPNDQQKFGGWLRQQGIDYVVVPRAIHLSHAWLPIVFQNRFYRVHRVAGGSDQARIIKTTDHLP